MFRIRLITKTSSYLKNYVQQTRVKRKLIPCIDDIDCWHALDPTSLYAAELDGKPIGMAFVFKYDCGYRQGGGFYIEERYQKSGYGVQLAREVFKKSEPTSNICVYTHHHMVEMNKKNFGFREVLYSAEAHDFNAITALENLQSIPKDPSYHVKQVSDLDFEALVNYDKLTFGYDRRQFLFKWLFSPVSHSCVALNNKGSVIGYVVARESCVPDQGYRIGPLFCEDIRIGFALLRSVLKRVKELGTSTSDSVRMCCPIGRNSQVDELLKTVESRRFDSFQFLATNGHPKSRVHKWLAATSLVSG